MKHFLIFFYIIFILNYNYGKAFLSHNISYDLKDSNSTFHKIVIQRTSIIHYTSLISYLPSSFLRFLKMIGLCCNCSSKNDQYNNFPHKTTKKFENEISNENNSTTLTYTTKDANHKKEDKIENSSEEQKDNSLSETEKDLEITKNATDVLNRIENKILLKEHKIKKLPKKKNKEKKKKGPTTTLRPLENPNLFQGDIILTKEQARALIKSALKCAKRKKVKIPKYKSKLSFMRN